MSRTAEPQARRLPILATVLVLAAVGTMIWLGVWQLRRMEEKGALLARYAASEGVAAEVPWPATEQAAQLSLYRRSRLLCVRVVGQSGMAGRNAKDEVGMAQYAQCLLPDGSQAKVVLGWSEDPTVATVWTGGEVRGTIAPGPRLVADPPLAGLEANERPDPSGLPNNHLAYAVQWFFFAATALVIYGVALRRRLKA